MSTSPIDARGPQFNATLTSVVLAAALGLAALGQTGAAVVLLGLQAALFATAVLLGVQRTPAAYLFKTYVKPRLGPPTHLEDPRPPRFAQGIGLAFAISGLVGFTTGPAWLGFVATGFALVAALLNATIQVCLGCKVYGVCHLPQQHYPTTTNISTTNPKEEVHA